MKRFIVGIIVLAVMLGLYGCNLSVSDRNSGKNVKLDISIKEEDKDLIPDPTDVNGTVKIQLHEQLDHDQYDFWDEASDEQKDRYFANLSFAGFKNEVLVTSFVVGNMTSTESVDSQIHYIDKKDKNESVKGNCLGLFVMDVKDRSVEEMELEGDCYFVVVDYANHTYYKTKTDFFLHDMVAWTSLKAIDITGDGKKELVAEHCYNKSIELGIFRCDEKTHKLVNLFSTLDDVKDDEDYPDRALFSGYPTDNYKVKLKFKEIGYSQTISLLDLGFKKEDLESGQNYDWMDDDFVSLWKNGKILKDKVDKDTVFLYTLDYVDFISAENGMPQIDVVRSVCIGHRSEWLGNMHEIYEYDQKEDRLIMKDARFVGEKEAEKEMKTWEITDDMPMSEE